MGNKKTKMIFAVMLLLAVGFAAVSTNLIINGTAIFRTNEDDFDVIFTKAIIDDTDVSNIVISEDGKTINYTTNELAIKGDKSILDFEVTNNSTQYDAEVEIVCEATGNHANTYYSVTSEVAEVIAAKTKENGNVTVELLRTSVNEIEETFTCTITTNAVEREETATGTESLYNLIATNADRTTTIDFSQHSGTSGTNGIYVTTNTDGGNEVYYYRGNVDNNVVFADLCWKMIRTTESGGVKLIYNGVPAEDGSCNNTGEVTEIGASAFNSLYNENAYVGYMYGTSGSTTYADTHANTNESDIKKVIDAWYLENIENKGYTNYLEDTIFCNDRNPVTGGDNNNLSVSDYGILGYGTNITGYGVLARASYWTTIPTPSLVCKNTQGSVKENHDAFTVSEENGNGKLTYPVGLVTLDEAIYAGFNTYTSNTSDYQNTNNYLYTGSTYWTFSPVNMSTGGAVNVGHINSSGNVHHYGVNNANGVRPVISLAAGTKITPNGTGTVTNPYVVVEN